jgi:hypothetical protein
MIFRLIDWLNMALGPGSWSGKSKSPTHRDSKARHAIVSRSEWRAEALTGPHPVDTARKRALRSALGH